MLATIRSRYDNLQFAKEEKNILRQRTIVKEISRMKRSYWRTKQLWRIYLIRKKSRITPSDDYVTISRRVSVTSVARCSLSLGYSHSLYLFIVMMCDRRASCSRSQNPRARRARAIRKNTRGRDGSGGAEPLRLARTILERLTLCDRIDEIFILRGRSCGARSEEFRKRKICTVTT